MFVMKIVKNECYSQFQFFALLAIHFDFQNLSLFGKMSFPTKITKKVGFIITVLEKSGKF
jgi:hypothetical protein